MIRNLVQIQLKNGNESSIIDIMSYRDILKR